MVDGVADRLFEFGRPGFRRLAGPRIDQVEGQPRKDLARQADRRQRLLDIVQPAEESADRRSFSACTPSETRLTPAAR